MICAPEKLNSQPVSRVLSWIIIHLDWKSPSSLKQPTRKRRGPRHCFPIWSCSGWGLPCHSCYQQRGALLPHPFTLTSRSWRSSLCCTGRRLAPPRRYLAPCPVEPGLSSPQATRKCLRSDRLTNSAHRLQPAAIGGKHRSTATPRAAGGTELLPPQFEQMLVE